jgi:hypothetical protein
LQPKYFALVGTSLSAEPVQNLSPETSQQFKTTATTKNTTVSSRFESPEPRPRESEEMQDEHVANVSVAADAAIPPFATSGLNSRSPASTLPPVRGPKKLRPELREFLDACVVPALVEKFFVERK